MLHPERRGIKMKKKLFALVLIISCNCMFILAFTALDSHGKITDLLNNTKLVNATDSPIGDSTLRQPMPKPRKPTEPPPELN